MTLEDLRNYSAIVAAMVALLVFIVNTRSQARNRKIENLARFNEVHQRLFATTSYLGKNLKSIETGTMIRNMSDIHAETKFHLMLLEIERLAILANNKAVPRSTQVYMFGSYAPTILKLMTQQETESMFWELARNYLKGVALDADHYGKLTEVERSQFWR